MKIYANFIKQSAFLLICPNKKSTVIIIIFVENYLFKIKAISN